MKITNIYLLEKKKREKLTQVDTSATVDSLAFCSFVYSSFFLLLLFFLTAFIQSVCVKKKISAITAQRQISEGVKSSRSSKKEEERNKNLTDTVEREREREMLEGLKVNLNYTLNYVLKHDFYCQNMCTFQFVYCFVVTFAFTVDTCCL